MKYRLKAGDIVCYKGYKATVLHNVNKYQRIVEVYIENVCIIKIKINEIIKTKTNSLEGLPKVDIRQRESLSVRGENPCANSHQTKSPYQSGGNVKEGTLSLKNINKSDDSLTGFNLSKKAVRFDEPSLWFNEKDIKLFIQKLMQRLESQMIDGNKLKFSHTIVTIKELAGEQLSK